MHTKMSFSKVRITLAGVVLALAAGCAHVEVVPITDHNRGTQEGFRYYLPRPYLAVKKPFPVAGDEFFIQGIIKDDKVIAVDTSSLPPALRDYFPSGEGESFIGTAQVRSPIADQDTTSGEGFQQQAGAKPVPKGLDFENWLSATVVPQILSADDKQFTITAKLAKNAPLTTNSNTSVKLGLLPKAADGSVAMDKFVDLGKLSSVTAFDPGKTDGSYSATGVRSDIKEGADFVTAIQLDGRTNESRNIETLLVYGEKVVLHVDKAKAPQPSKPDQQTGTETTKQSTEQPAYTSAKVTTSGDPHTDPLLKVSDYFDVLYLPDMDEQYAIRVTAGLGSAKADIGLENGWLVEHATVDIDNRELGKFVFSNISKVVDLGIKAAEFYINPASAAIPKGSNTLFQQGFQKSDLVLLRVRFAIEAEPGVYPILKRSKQEKHHKQWSDAQAARDDHYVFTPYPPYTVVAYNVRRYLDIENVSAAPKPRAGDPTPPGSQSSAISKALVPWLEKLKTNKILDDPTVKVLSNVDPKGLLLNAGTLLIKTKNPSDSAIRKKLTDTLNAALKNSDTSLMVGDTKVEEIQLGQP
jgi:hypothetical protein